MEEALGMAGRDALEKDISSAERDQKQYLSRKKKHVFYRRQ
jgi:hypothetical protein